MNKPTDTKTEIGPQVRCIELLGHVITTEDIEKTKDDIDSSTTHEVLMMAALCRVLANTTHKHAQELADDGFTLKSDEAEQRANQYTETYWAICHEWPVS
jgi:hypothetical protein